MNPTRAACLLLVLGWAVAAPAQQDAGGKELQMFQRGRYAQNQSLVDRARLLDEDSIIDIKACQTMMRTLNIEQDQLPGFIEQVPYAPAEIERLQREEGFTRL